MAYINGKEILFSAIIGSGSGSGSGSSPVYIELTKENGVTTLTITDASGTQTATINDGVGIKSVEQTTTSTEDGGMNVITLEFTDGTSSAFTVRNGSRGERGTGILKVTTSPTSYTTTTAGISPIKRMSLSTIKSQSGVDEVLVGDSILYSYYLYHIYYLDATYAYMDSYQSIRGAGGANGTSVTVSSVSENTESGGTNVVTFSDGKTLSIKNGKDGEDYVLTDADKAEIAGMVEENAKGDIVQSIIEELQGLPVFGIVDENKIITVTSQLSSGAYTLKYENADGTTEEIGTITVGGKTFTNLADPTSADWLTNHRLSTSGTSALSGAIVTNFINASNTDVIRIKGLDVCSMFSNSSYPRMHCFDMSGTNMAGEFYPYHIINGGHGSIENDIYTIEGLYNGTTSLNGNISTVSKVRFCGVLLPGYTAQDVIITVNEEIV